MPFSHWPPINNRRRAVGLAGVVLDRAEVPAVASAGLVVAPVAAVLVEVLARAEVVAARPATSIQP